MTAILYDRGERFAVHTGAADGGRPGYVTRVQRNERGNWQTVTTCPSESIAAATVMHNYYAHREGSRALAARTAVPA